jgi:hypothetical protein
MMTFFQESSVGSIEQRALTPEGVDLLEYIATRQRRLQHTFLIDIMRKINYRKGQAPAELLALINAGFVETRKFDLLGPSNNTRFGQKLAYRLTQDGWDIVGNKPIWLD